MLLYFISSFESLQIGSLLNELSHELKSIFVFDTQQILAIRYSPVSAGRTLLQLMSLHV